MRLTNNRNKRSDRAKIVAYLLQLLLWIFLYVSVLSYFVIKLTSVTRGEGVK